MASSGSRDALELGTDFRYAKPDRSLLRCTVCPSEPSLRATATEVAKHRRSKSHKSAVSAASLSAVPSRADDDNLSHPPQNVPMDVDSDIGGMEPTAFDEPDVFYTSGVLPTPANSLFVDQAIEALRKRTEDPASRASRMSDEELRAEEQEREKREREDQEFERLAHESSKLGRINEDRWEPFSSKALAVEAKQGGPGDVEIDEDGEEE